MRKDGYLNFIYFLKCNNNNFAAQLQSADEASSGLCYATTAFLRRHWNQTQTQQRGWQKQFFSFLYFTVLGS